MRPVTSLLPFLAVAIAAKRKLLNVGRNGSSDAAILLDAIKDVESKTCVRFVKKRKIDESYVIFDGNDRRCASYVGRVEGMPDGQIVALGNRCVTKGTIQHELMHLLGFWHEHQRSDRDLYVKVIRRNIIPSKLRQFDIRADNEAMIIGSYDFNSLLHYDAYAFTQNGEPSLQRLDGSIDLGNRKEMTRMDVEKINKLYRCDRHPSRHPIKCGEEQHCEDDFPEECPTLAKKGWCEKMPGKMLFKCKRSCCNCDEKQCFDTKKSYYYRNYCEHFFDKETKDYIYSPETCMHPASTETTRRFCPKLCNLCST